MNMSQALKLWQSIAQNELELINRVAINTFNLGYLFSFHNGTGIISFFNTIIQILEN